MPQDLTIDNLALLYQGLLTTIVRVRSGRQPIGNYDAFRQHFRDVISGVEQEAIRLGYPAADVRNTSYAVVAFLDEAVFGSNDPSRNVWSSLQSDMYGEAVAGESFFEQLELLRRRQDSHQLADILEVYYLCLLLGYQGRYATYGRERLGELRRTMDELRMRIEGARGSAGPLSPDGLFDVSVERTPLPTPRSSVRQLKITCVAAVVTVIAVWIACRILLLSQIANVSSTLTS